MQIDINNHNTFHPSDMIYCVVPNTFSSIMHENYLWLADYRLQSRFKSGADSCIRFQRNILYFSLTAFFSIQCFP